MECPGDKAALTLLGVDATSFVHILQTPNKGASGTFPLAAWDSTL